MRYPVKLKDESKGYTVTFPDIPEAITCGDDVEDALHQAADALETTVDIYFEYKRPFPLPSVPKRNQYSVVLPAGVSAKVLLHNEMIAQHVRPSELARRLSIPRQDITRLLDPRHKTRIDNIEQALHALGKSLEMRLS